MIYNLIAKLLTINYLHRSIAIFFVLFIFLDITHPEVCAEEFFPDAIALENNIFEKSIESPTLIKAFIDQHQTTSDSHHNSNTQDGDCFCCCTHWLLSKTFSLPLPSTTKPVYQMATISLPVAPARNIFHPPCFA